MSCSFDALGVHKEMRLVETTTPFGAISEVEAAFKQFFEDDVKRIFTSWIPTRTCP